MSQTSFYDNVEPALTAGDYQLIVQDTVTADGQDQPPYAAVQRFRVTGPRVGLGANDVVAVCPPAGSQGIYDSWLPHVVLAQRSLPWQVAIADGADPAVPWLALLLLTPQEIDVAGTAPAAGATGVQTVPLSACLTPPAGTLGPTTAGLKNLLLEQPGLTCSVVDVTLDAFRAVAPQSGELPYLAHVRQVDASDQETLQVPAPGWYSVVVGTRFPVGAPDGTIYIAHLVSLEGLAGYLPDKPAPTGSLVRLISLASWTFNSAADNGGDFAYLAEHLKLKSFTVPVTVSGTDAASQLVSGALADGYTLLGYTTRFGEQTAAWYRGPCQPAPVTANPQPAFPAASAALIYDPATGMFDTSYAAAWEIGRLLTLANGPVSRSLATWTAAAVRANRLLLERTRTAPGQSTPAQAALLARGARQRAARLLIAERVVPALLGHGGARPALGPPGDPTGLRGRGLPGVFDADTLHQLTADSDDPYGKLLEHAIAAARNAAASTGISAAPAAHPAAATQAPAPQAAAGAGIQEETGAQTGPGPDASLPRHEALRQLAADPAAQAMVQAAAGPVPADVSAWLTGLQQLSGLPFSYLVPDARMLPPESIRFFAVDPNWTAALVDGALSLAAATAPGASAIAALRPAVLAASRATATGTATGTAPTSGFLLRSALVSGWPGLTVTGYADPQGTTAALPLTRLERLAPTVLLALFTGVIACVELTEPPQHMHFGVVEGTPPTVLLRWIDATRGGVPATVGVPPTELTAAVVPRPDATRTVLDLNATIGQITQKLTQAYTPQTLPHLGSAALSLQFLQVTAQQPFSTAVPVTT
jgi:hypothetical protein